MHRPLACGLTMCMGCSQKRDHVLYICRAHVCIYVRIDICMHACTQHACTQHPYTQHACMHVHACDDTQATRLSLRTSSTSRPIAARQTAAMTRTQPQNSRANRGCDMYAAPELQTHMAITSHPTPIFPRPMAARQTLKFPNRRHKGHIRSP